MQLSNRMLTVLLIAVNLVWASSYIVNKLILPYFAVSQILFVRIILASICYFFLFKHILPIKNYKKGDWKFFILAGCCEPCLVFWFETQGLSYTTASQAGMIVACAPLATAMGAFFVYKESIGKKCSWGIFWAIIGVVIISFAGSATESAPHPLWGNALMIGAVLSTTINVLIVKQLAYRHSFIVISAAQCIVGSLFFLPQVIHLPFPTAAPLEAWLGLLYLGFIVTFAALLTYNKALTCLKAGHVMLFSNLIPLFTLGLALVILQERLSVTQYMGAAIVMAGVVLAGIPETTATTASKTL